MTARAGFLAPAGTHGSGTEARKGHTAAVRAGPAIPAPRWKMRAKNNLGVLVTWFATGADPDETGLLYTGGNLPLSGVHVAASWQL